MKLLDAAGAALQAGQPKAALDSLLAAWRKSRAPALASLIEAVGEKAKGPLSPKSGERSGPQAWTLLEKTRDPAMLPWLLQELDRAHRTDLTQTQLERLLEWPADPRIADAAIAMLSEDALFYRTARRLVPPLLELVLRNGHPQDATKLRRLANSEGLPGPWVSRLRDLADALGKLRSVTIPAAKLRALRKHLAVEPVRSPPERSLVELFQAVYDSPGTDDARHVLADTLQEQGDPRGTFIALQLARAATGEEPSAEEEKLWKRWQRQWSAPLGDATFERGFAARVSLYGSAKADPAWSTVETLSVLEDDETLPRLLGSAPLRHLKRLDGVTISSLLSTLEAQPGALQSLESLTLVDREVTGPEVKRLLASSLPSHLKELRMNAAARGGSSPSSPRSARARRSPSR